MCAYLAEFNMEPCGAIKDAVLASLELSEPVDVKSLPGLYLTEHVQLPLVVDYPEEFLDEITWRELINNWANQGLGQFLADDKTVLVAHINRATPMKELSPNTNNGHSIHMGPLRCHDPWMDSHASSEYMHHPGFHADPCGQHYNLWQTHPGLAMEQGQRSPCPGGDPFGQTKAQLFVPVLRSHRSACFRPSSTHQRHQRRQSWRHSDPPRYLPWSRTARAVPH